MNPLTKILDFSQGRFLVAGDVRGNWKDYAEIYNKFQQLRHAGEVDLLVYTGNLIHGDNPDNDYSVEILQDLIDTQDKRVITLFGEHEVMQIYHYDPSEEEINSVEHLDDEIQKLLTDEEGNPVRHEDGTLYNPFIEYLKQMPYAIRTQSGITISHAGPSFAMAGLSLHPICDELVGPAAFDMARHMDHDFFLSQITILLRKEMEAKAGFALDPEYFAAYTPEIGNTFASSDAGNALWDLVANSNEQTPDFVIELLRQKYPDFPAEDWYGSAMIPLNLVTMSQDLPQKCIVSSHIPEEQGHRIVTPNHLRISSSYKVPDEKKQLLIVDAAKNYESVDDLAEGLISLY